MTLDMDFVRAQFPAFAEPSLQGQAFFENAGGSYTCKPVIDRLLRFYTQRKVQPYSDYNASRLGGEEMDEARLRMAAILGVEEDELSFGPSTTQNTYVLAQAFAQMMQPGVAIIVTTQDHEANTGPGRRLAQRGIDEIMLVSDRAHLPRALLCFQSQGVLAQAAWRKRLPKQEWVPSAGALSMVPEIWYEWLALVWYHLRYL